MIKSMTGYGKGSCELEKKKLTVEIRSLNSRQLDLNLRIPAAYREKEMGIRSELSKIIVRGKADVSISSEITGDIRNFTINKTLAKGYYEELHSLSKELKTGTSDFLQLVLGMPEVLKPEKNDLDEPEWNKMHSTIHDAIDDFNAYRLNEGRILMDDFISRIGKINQLLLEVDPFEFERAEKIRERLRKGLTIFAGEEHIDMNRFEQEMLFYIEKIDITEEKLRLKSNCEYFIETLKSKESEGRKLNFITQEIGREINTIGSKANDSDIQKIVVQMKDELEKVKEQLANVL